MAVSNKTLTRVALARRWHLGWWCLALSVPLTAWSQTAYPQRPVKLVAPFPPGGTSDVLARVIGQAVVVDNKPGASGNLAYQTVARAPKDGHTLLVSYSGYHIANPILMDKLSWDLK